MNQNFKKVFLSLAIFLALSACGGKQALQEKQADGSDLHDLYDDSVAIAATHGDPSGQSEFLICKQRFPASNCNSLFLNANGDPVFFDRELMWDWASQMKTGRMDGGVVLNENFSHIMYPTMEFRSTYPLHMVIEQLKIFLILRYYGPAWECRWFDETFRTKIEDACRPIKSVW